MATSAPSSLSFSSSSPQSCSRNCSSAVRARTHTEFRARTSRQPRAKASRGTSSSNGTGSISHGHGCRIHAATMNEKGAHSVGNRSKLRLQSMGSSTLLSAHTGDSRLCRTSGHLEERGARRDWAARCSLDEAATTEKGLQVMELPCLPFTPVEVLVPASTKTLHLYEARYLALLDEVMNKTQGLFAHILLEPMKAELGEGGVSFVASRCCLSYVESVRRLEVGALITVRGISRMRLLSLTQMEPFLKASLTAQVDAEDVDGKEEKNVKGLEAQLEELKDVVRDVQRLQLRLKSPGDSPMMTPLEEAVQWAEKSAAGNVPSLTEPQQRSARAPLLKSNVSFPLYPAPLADYLPPRAELVAFASLQPATAASPAELHKLLQARLRAMEAEDPVKRIQICREYAEETRASLAAKLALQNFSSAS